MKKPEQKKDPLVAEHKFFRFAHVVLRAIMCWLLPYKFTGKENIPAGPAVICINHTAIWDPLYMMIALPKKEFPSAKILAKAVLFTTPVLGGILRRLGTINVARDGADIKAVSASIKHLKAGGKLIIFPEGTRGDGVEAREAKIGAVKMAAKVNAPILPVYIPKNKGFFRRCRMIIGKPVPAFPQSDVKPTNEELLLRADEIMAEIYQLGAKG
ncbi:MAG: 1-acyl-sn-glycerol-3-phosphate acyltransferase [Oscillospiraceae bacterium]|nr:1-acyl-sn-glycerol-3-phosphate acyltransferase [Oscillospiraceae bacterium]